MIIAELYGKISSKLEDMEDILTSNVFSFFKYSNRQLLMGYLSQLGISVTLKDSENAEFLFWQSYDDGTEPDLVVICGEYYILFEAKLYSDFSPQTAIIASQISREIKMGKLAAENLGKEFVYVAITAEYHKNKTKFLNYEKKEFNFIWTNWQSVTSFLENNISNHTPHYNNGFIKDLHSLLIKKRLRSYKGISNVKGHNNYGTYNSIFYDFKSSKFKGEFSGYKERLSEFMKIGLFDKFFQKEYFQGLRTFKFYLTNSIFYYGD